MGSISLRPWGKEVVDDLEVITENLGMAVEGVLDIIEAEE